MAISVTDLHGRIVDCDSHLMPTGDMYREFLVDEFGRFLVDRMQERADSVAADTERFLTWADPDRHRPPGHVPDHPREPGQRLAEHLSDKPSEYVKRNIRVTPFDGEPVGEFIARDGLEDVYVFSTDYPHAEGGTDPIGNFHRSLVEHGHSDEVIEKFFVKNGEAILPVRQPAVTA